MSPSESINQLFIFLRFLEELITSNKMGIVSHIVSISTLFVYFYVYLYS